MPVLASDNELQTIRRYYRYDATLASAGQPAASQLELLPGTFNCVINRASSFVFLHRILNTGYEQQPAAAHMAA